METITDPEPSQNSKHPLKSRDGLKVHIIRAMAYATDRGKQFGTVEMMCDVPQ